MTIAPQNPKSRPRPSNKKAAAKPVVATPAWKAVAALGIGILVILLGLLGSIRYLNGDSLARLSALKSHFRTGNIDGALADYDSLKSCDFFVVARQRDAVFAKHLPKIASRAEDLAETGEYSRAIATIAYIPKTSRLGPRRESDTQTWQDALDAIVLKNVKTLERAHKFKEAEGELGKLIHLERWKSDKSTAILIQSVIEYSKKLQLLNDAMQEKDYVKAAGIALPFPPSRWKDQLIANINAGQAAKENAEAVEDQKLQQRQAGQPDTFYLNVGDPSQVNFSYNGNVYSQGMKKNDFVRSFGEPEYFDNDDGNLMYMSRGLAVQLDSHDIVSEIRFVNSRNYRISALLLTHTDDKEFSPANLRIIGDTEVQPNFRSISSYAATKGGLKALGHMHALENWTMDGPVVSTPYLSHTGEHWVQDDHRYVEFGFNGDGSLATCSLSTTPLQHPATDGEVSQVSVKHQHGTQEKAAVNAKSIFDSKCAGCHGSGGSGGMGPSLIQVVTKGDSFIRARIMKGSATKGMPAFGDAGWLKPAEVDAMVKYVKTL